MSDPRDMSSREIFDFWSEKAIAYATTAALLTENEELGTLDEDEQEFFEAGIIMGLAYVLQSAEEVGALPEIHTYIAKILTPPPDHEQEAMET